MPELVPVVDAILVLAERLLEERENLRDDRKVIWHRLPPLDVLNDLCRLLPLPEVDHVSRDLVLSTIVDERQCRKIRSCEGTEPMRDEM